MTKFCGRIVWSTLYTNPGLNKAVACFCTLSLRLVQVLDNYVQVAILAGDFLLARASVTLAALRDSEVIQLLSQVIEDLVTGEILQAGPCQTCCQPYPYTNRCVEDPATGEMLQAGHCPTLSQP